MDIIKHESAVVWLTGLSGSGKTTIATKLGEDLRKRGIHVILLDGDELRRDVCKDLGFSPKDRHEMVRRIGKMAKDLSKIPPAVVIVSVISPYIADRAKLRKKIENFIEVYVKCPFDVCVKRDTKGLYAKAASGEIKDFTGVSAPYEEPTAPDFTLNTDAKDVQSCVDSLREFVELKILSRTVENPKPAEKYGREIRIGFDIGGVISKYPDEMREMMWMLDGNDSVEGSPFEIYIITDMPRAQAIAMLKENKVCFNEGRLLCADWAKHGDRCKSILMAEHKIDIMIDDRLDYIMEGCRIGLFVVPRPDVGYYAKGWKFPDLKEQRLKELAEELGYDLVKKKDEKALGEFMTSFRESLEKSKK